MDAILLSIPHTGTHFTMGILKTFRGTHVLSEGWENLVNLKPIVPMRNPLAVAISWKARGKSLGPLWDGFDALRSVAHKVGCWFPIDAPNRDFHLSQLSDFIGRPLSTEWEKVYSCGSTAELSRQEHKQAICLMPFYEGLL